MKLSKAKREQVVELLRCTADHRADDDPRQSDKYPRDFGRQVGFSLDICELAGDLQMHICRSSPGGDGHSPVWIECLEAAQRVEDGDLP